MITRFAFATALIVGAVGTAAAGPTITNYNYWPNELGPRASQKQVPAPRSQAVRPPEPSQACAYAGGARSVVRTCR